MRLSLNLLLCAAFVFLLSTAPLATEQNQQTEGKNSAAPAAVDIQSNLKLLNNIVHLSDNDIRIRTKDGVVIFVDPVSGPAAELAIKAGMLKPDLILITHPHEDHFQPAVLQEYLKLNPKALLAGPADVVVLAQQKGIKDFKSLEPGQDYTIAGIDIHTVPACFLQGDSHPQAKKWVGYNLNVNGIQYYITGDTQPLPEMAQQKVDVIFPLLSGCGGNLDQAVKMTELCKAQIAVPVHHSGHEEVIKRYIAKLPQGVYGAYYLNAVLVQ
jgi:L-ascorbate metabolism protein UlaG (beta-lactamase superfamily)